MLIHATCIALKDKGVLLTGAPGIGKSDMAAKLIAEGAILVADDQTQLMIKDNKLWGAPPQALQGLIEIRHCGIYEMPFLSQVPIALCVELVENSDLLERLPADEDIFLLDHSIPRLRLPAFLASTSSKIRLVLTYSRAQ